MKQILLILLITCPCLAYPAKVIKVHDGDTIWIQTEEGKEKIRLSNIDCPELAQEFGEEARKETEKLLLSRTVEIESEGKDKYKRVLAEIYLPEYDNSVNKLLVVSGSCWRYIKSNNGVYQVLQDKAKTEKRGLWKSSTAINPASWRKNH